MGEAKIKEDKRRVHATMIVAAFECFIDTKLEARIDNFYTGAVNDTRQKLIDILVTPPPK